MDSPQKTPRRRGEWADKRRLRLLRENPLCVECLKVGKAVQARELDHIVPLCDGGPDSEENLQGLCHNCHVAKSLRERGVEPKAVVGADGWPV
jgi:5-methylcytosine-specific restriction protein A